MTPTIFTRYIPLIEHEMQQALAGHDQALAQHYGMLQYHMGWVDENLQPAQNNSGKRVRPLLCLLACQAVGGELERALPAAAALELVHNFSLIHDDIQDNSPTRRHRPTVWAVWGRAQAINVGDAMFTLAHLALQRLYDRGLSADLTLQACRVFESTCLILTEGQFLDMRFEDRLDVSVAEYLTMIESKTAALLSASPRLGGLVGGADRAICGHLDDFGQALGMAFQIQDDLLGIWGDEALTGKSAKSDIITRKKSLPVVYALAHPQAGPRLRSLYARPLAPEDVPAVLALLAQADARSYTETMARRAHDRALEALEASGVLAGGNEAGQALLQVADLLLNRRR